MRKIIIPQLQLDFSPKPTKETLKFHSKYDAISKLLDENPKILKAVNADLAKPLKYTKAATCNGRTSTFSSDQVLRILIVMAAESLSLREAVVRIDDSCTFRRFTRLYNSKMMDFTTLNKLRNSILPGTWEKVNQLLAKFAVTEDLISGERLRLDMTATETNIHYSTDSSLLWDCYRVLGKLILDVRSVDPSLAKNRRIHFRRVKKLNTKAGRVSGLKNSAELLEPIYIDLIWYVESISALSTEVAFSLSEGLRNNDYLGSIRNRVTSLIARLDHFTLLASKVLHQASQRVLHGTPVSNDSKIFSIFEEHTELLKRGKAGKPIEFGHMVELEQVKEKFITKYQVYLKRPAEPDLLAESIEHHKKLFGQYPKILATDKGYYEKAVVESIRKKVELVSISKKGKRSNQELQLEHCEAFKEAQRFRAGIEGSIAFLKRKLGLDRCLNKGWEHFSSTVGLAVFAHNLIKLASP